MSLISRFFISAFILNGPVRNIKSRLHCLFNCACHVFCNVFSSLCAFSILMQLFTFFKLPHNMLVQWNTRMKQTAGFCYNRWTVTSPGTKIRSSRIAISTKVHCILLWCEFCLCSCSVGCSCMCFSNCK
jgi:hypothetical protein